MKGLIKQYGILVDNIYETMKNFWEMFGIGPWNVRRFNPETVREFYVDGKHMKDGFEFYSAVCMAGNIELEIIQPVRGNVIFTEQMKMRGNGLHHFKIEISDERELEEYVRKLEEYGCRVLQTGWYGGEVHYYMDTYDKLGVVVELGNGGSFCSTKEIFPAKDVISPVKQRIWFRQIGIVVRDAVKTIGQFGKILGIEGWKLFRFNQDNLRDFTINGKMSLEAFEFLCAVKWIGDIELEVVQPVQGPLIYWNYLKQGPGFHHVKNVTSDQEIRETMKRLIPYGIQCIQSGRIGDNKHYYMNTEEWLGFSMEFGNGGQSIAER